MEMERNGKKEEKVEKEMKAGRHFNSGISEERKGQFLPSGGGEDRFGRVRLESNPSIVGEGTSLLSCMNTNDTELQAVSFTNFTNVSYRLGKTAADGLGPVLSTVDRVKFAEDGGDNHSVLGGFRTEQQNVKSLVCVCVCVCVLGSGQQCTRR
jgi:hypothetical protein